MADQLKQKSALQKGKINFSNIHLYKVITEMIILLEWVSLFVVHFAWLAVSIRALNLLWWVTPPSVMQGALGA